MIEACVVSMILRPMFLAAACGQEMIEDIGYIANTMIQYALDIDWSDVGNTSDVQRGMVVARMWMVYRD